MSTDWGNGGSGDWGSDAASAVADASPDAFEFDANQADPDKVGGRGTVDKPGKYHFEIVDVKAELETVGDNGSPKTPSINFTLRVLESTHGQSPAGSLAWHRLYVGEKGGGPPKQGSFDAIIDFLVAIGRMKKVIDGGVTRFINPQTGTSKFTLQLLLQAKGDQFIGNVKREQKKDREGNKIDEWEVRLPFSGGSFRLDDSAVSDVPKNRDAATLWSPVTNDRGEVHFPGDAATVQGEKPKRGRGKKAEEPAPAASTPASAPQPAPSATATAAAPAKPSTPAAPAAVADDDF